MHPATGGSAMGEAAGDLPSQMGLSPRASRRGPPTPLTTTRGAEQGAVVAAPPRRSRSRAARGQRGARGWVRAQWSLAVARSTRRRTRPLGLQIRQVRGAPGNLCASQGPGRRGRRGFQSLGSGSYSPRPAPQDPAPGAPARPAGCPGARLGWGGGRGLGTTHLCPPFLSAAQAGPPVSSQPASRAGGGGRRRCGVRGGGGPACSTPRLGRARCYPASRARRRARCAARRGAGSQRAAAAASRTERALAGAAAQPRSPAPGPGKREPGRSLGARAGEGAGARGADATAGVPPPRRSGAGGRLWGLGVRTGTPLDPRGRAHGSRILGGGLRGESDPARTRGAGQRGLPSRVSRA